MDRCDIPPVWILHLLHDPANLRFSWTVSDHASQCNLPCPCTAVVTVICVGVQAPRELVLGLTHLLIFTTLTLHGVEETCPLRSRKQTLMHVQLSLLQVLYLLLLVQKSASTFRTTPSFKSTVLRKWAWPDAFSQRRKWKHFTFHYKVGLDVLWYW